MIWNRALLPLSTLVFLPGCWSPDYIRQQEINLHGLTLQMPSDFRQWYALSPDRYPGFETGCDQFFGREQSPPILMYPGIGVDYRTIAPGFSWEEEAVEEALEPHFLGLFEKRTLSSFQKEPLVYAGLTGISYSWERYHLDPGTEPASKVITYQEGVVFIHPEDHRLLIKIFYEEISSQDRGVPVSPVARASARYILTHFQAQHLDSSSFFQSCINCSGHYGVARASHFLQIGQIQSSLVLAKQVLACPDTKKDLKLTGDCYLLLAKCYRLKDDFLMASECARMAKNSYMEASYSLGVSCTLVEEAILAQVVSTEQRPCELLEEALEYYKKSVVEDPAQSVPIYIFGIRNFGELIKKALREFDCDEQPEQPVE